VGAADYTNCNTVCAASGQTCVENGCDGYTYEAWYSMADCTTLRPPTASPGASCTDFLGWGDAVRCCCTDDPVEGDNDVAPTCSDTLSDPLNCGICGYQCRSNVCEDGVCAPDLGPCFDFGDDFTNCDEVCAAIGESCVETACTAYAYTLIGWASEMSCTEGTTASIQRSWACNETFDWDGMSYPRCCCTDTP